MVNALRLPGRVAEHLPDTRNRFAVSGRIAQRLAGSTFILTERLYGDDWGLKASTTDLRLVKNFLDLSPADSPLDFFICGGAQIYEQSLPHCSDLYLTLVKREYEGDAFFPPFEDRFELVEDDETLLRCIIEDDGVGYNKGRAKQAAQQGFETHRSRGMEITTERLNLLHELLITSPILPMVF